MMILVAMALATGPISKFADHRTDADFDSGRKLEDIERCLIDTNSGLPAVYRQPDRPDDVTLLWSTRGLAAAASSRIDLHRTPAGAHVRSWSAEDIAHKCGGGAE